MTDLSNHLRLRNEQGFVLVTSLIFLVVLTLLAVSAINSSTLQERMAANQRDRSRALHAANAALRHAETLLKQPLSNAYQADEKGNGEDGGNHAKATRPIHIWSLDGMFGSPPDDESLAFLNKEIWAQSNIQTYQTKSGSASADSRLPPVQYFVEDYKCMSRDLNPDSCARGISPILYRITARAQSKNPNTVVVTQSLYEKGY